MIWLDTNESLIISIIRSIKSQFVAHMQQYFAYNWCDIWNCGFSFVFLTFNFQSKWSKVLHSINDELLLLLGDSTFCMADNVSKCRSLICRNGGEFAIQLAKMVLRFGWIIAQKVQWFGISDVPLVTATLTRSWWNIAFAQLNNV